MKIEIMYEKPVITIPKEADTYREAVRKTTCTDMPVAVKYGDVALKVAIPGWSYLKFLAEDAYIPAIVPGTSGRDALHIALTYMTSELWHVTKEPIMPMFADDSFSHRCTIEYNATNGNMEIDHDGEKSTLGGLNGTFDNTYVDYDYTGLPKECVKALVLLNRNFPSK